MNIVSYVLGTYVLLPFFQSSIFKHLKRFRAEDDGAVTVDFVVLTSSIVLLGVAHAVDIAKATTNLSDDISSCLTDDIGDIVEFTSTEEYFAKLEAAAAGCSSK